MSEALAGILIAPFVIFLVIVAPVWIIAHYVSSGRRDRLGKTQVSSEDQEMMARMIALLEKMEGRIATLEQILEADDPRWRDKRAVNDRV